MIKLWAHECTRVFQDRLVSQPDRDVFHAMLTGAVQERFKREWSSLVQQEPLIFGSLVPLCYPNGDTTLKPYQDVYCDMWDKSKLARTCRDQLADYNSMNASKRMNLVLFDAAIEHVAKINRIITTEFGHALLMGVGGSGRKSLTALAVHMALFDQFEIEITKAYDFAAWREDMRKALFYSCGVEEKKTVFLLNDNQIIMEAFLEDVNNILNNGEIPNLYQAQEDVQYITEAMKDNPVYKNKGDNEIMVDFANTCKENIHIVLAMSPIGDDIKRRLRMFPALVNCCAIDYFLPWPSQALASVARHFLEEIPDLPMVDGIVDICVDMQERVTALAEKYLREQRRHYYVTPTSYLVLLQAFKELLARKRLAIDTVISKYSRGMDQLAMAKSEVGALQEGLKTMLPELEQARKETAEKIVIVDAKRIEVAEKTEVVATEENQAKEILQKAEKMKQDADFEVTRVMPIYNLAIRAVSQLKKDDITEIKGFSKPPEPAVAVIGTLIVLFGMEKKMLYKGTGREKVPDPWETGKKFVLTAQLLNNCKDFKKDEIKPETIEKLRPLIEDPMYDDRVLKNASNAAWGLAKWVRAMVQYDDAMKIVKPKRAEAEAAKAQASEAQALWDAAVEKLRAVEAEMKALVEELEAAEARKKQLQDDYESAKTRLDRAVALISKLKDEEKNWEKSLEQNQEFKKSLVGDIIIAAGVIAYLGVFSTDYRQSAVASWSALLQRFGLVSTQPYSLQQTLGDAVQIQKWHLDELPQEEVAVDNAIIMENSERWPLLIDPQMQGNNWIRRKEKKDNETAYRSIKPTTDSKKMSQILETCIQFGYPLLLEDSAETFDPLLEPLLAKQIIKTRNSWSIKLGDKTFDYAKDFRFYVTTKLSRPHFSPEVCVKVSMLNFMVTEEGLQDQMLNMVVYNEDKNRMEKRNEIQIQSADDNKKKAELEDLILNQIANNDQNLLEDDLLIATLDDSKAQCKQIEQKQEDNKQILVQIDGIRKTFETVARRVSRLFFVLIQIMNVNPMYQYSLKSFKDLFLVALKGADGIEKNKKNERKIFFVREFTRLLYDNICRSLFERDKLLFSFLMCLKIMEELETLNPHEAKFLMQGGTRVDLRTPNPTGDGGWMTDKTWANVLQASDELDCFKGLDDNFEVNLAQWERVYNSANPQDDIDDWPEPYNDLTLIRKAAIMRILRPDKVIPVVQELISAEKELGPEFIQPPAFDMEKSYNDSYNNVPIIIVLSAGADPMAELQKLAKAKNASVVGISLGQGQGDIAVDAIEHAKEAQQWVVLQNCHLSPSFMPRLDALLEKIPREGHS
jgi:dynein heavy chain